MKKYLFVILFATITAKGFGQIVPSSFSYPNSVGLFGLCEISFRLPSTYSNPYDPDTINLQTYYMINATQDTIFGWSQDTAFAYQSLRWLTDSVYFEQTEWGPIRRFKADAVYDSLGYVYTLDPLKKPAPSSNSNLITLDITNQPVGTTYSLKWYNSETGLPFHMAVMDVTVQQDLQGKKFLSFQFPSHIRNLGKHTINNTLGDAVFVLIRSNQVPSQKK